MGENPLPFLIAAAAVPFLAPAALGGAQMAENRKQKKLSQKQREGEFTRQEDLRKSLVRKTAQRESEAETRKTRLGARRRQRALSTSGGGALGYPAHGSTWNDWRGLPAAARPCSEPSLCPGARGKSWRSSGGH